MPLSVHFPVQKFGKFEGEVNLQTENLTANKLTKYAMKRVLFSLMAIVVAVVMTSCEKEVDFGYPKTISFTKDGGEKVITGTTKFTDAHIHDYKSGEDGEFVPREDEIWCQVYKWLTIEYLANSTELKIIAEPNASGKSRKLHIELHCGPEYQVVEVQQE